MSTRLQIVIDDEELAEIRRVARSQHSTVSEWARQALRAARREQPIYKVSTKIHVVREAVRHNYPAGEIDDVLGDIERGSMDGVEP